MNIMWKIIVDWVIMFLLLVVYDYFLHFASSFLHQFLGIIFNHIFKFLMFGHYLLKKKKKMVNNLYLNSFPNKFWVLSMIKWYACP